MSSTPAKPKRMTLSEIVEQLLSRGGGERSSVDLTRNAKGETQITVTVRTADTGDVQTIDDACLKAVELYDSLRSRYPMSDGNTGAKT